MALEFRKRRFHKPGKKMQYFLAFTALLTALVLVIGWGIVRHKLGERQVDSSSDEESSTVNTPYTTADNSHVLLILTDRETTRYLFLQASPAHKAIYAMPIPGELTVKDDTTVDSLYRKVGAADTVKALAASLQLPLTHHVTLTVKNAEKWCVALEHGVDFTLQEAVNYQTTDDIPATLLSGDHKLTATQIPSLALQSDTLYADMVAAILNQYLHKKRHLSTDFSRLADLAQTDLRIGDFTDYQTALDYLKTQNTGSLCRILTLPTQTDGGKIRINLAALKETAPLYQ